MGKQLWVSNLIAGRGPFLGRHLGQVKGTTRASLESAQRVCFKEKQRGGAGKSKYIPGGEKMAKRRSCLSRHMRGTGKTISKKNW